METLAEIYAPIVAEGWFCDRGTIHSYLDVYEIMFAPYRETAKRVLEIGVYDGGGLLFLERSFRNAEVRGIDVSYTPLDKVDLRPMIERGHLINIFDATSKDQVDEYCQDGIKFDIIIDDAAHTLDQQLKLMELWRPHLAGGGMMITEDIQDIDTMRPFFNAAECEIIDRRSIKNRYDDVFAVFRNKS